MAISHFFAEAKDPRPIAVAEPLQNAAEIETCLREVFPVPRLLGFAALMFLILYVAQQAARS